MGVSIAAKQRKKEDVCVGYVLGFWSVGRERKEGGRRGKGKGEMDVKLLLGLFLFFFAFWSCLLALAFLPFVYSTILSLHFRGGEKGSFQRGDLRSRLLIQNRAITRGWKSKKE